MTPEQVLNSLKQLGINTSRSTLLRFEQANAIPVPNRGSSGRGRGRFTDYSNDTPRLFFATWMLMKAEKIPLEEAATVSVLCRKISDTIEKKFFERIKGASDKLLRAKEAILSPKGWETILTLLTAGINASEDNRAEAQKCIAGWLENEDIRLTKRQHELIEKWNEYLMFTERPLQEFIEDAEVNERVIEAQNLLISKLNEENQKLREILLSHGITPD